MGRKPTTHPDEKLRVVLSVLKGEVTQVEIARQLGLSQTTISKWQLQFLEAGKEGLSRGDNKPTPQSRREQALREEVEDLTMALGEAQVELRVWRKKGGPKPFQRGLS